MTFEKRLDVDLFFSILPQDWKASILPFWDDYKSSTECFVIKNNNEVIAGGLVFSKCPPDMFYALDEANAFFENGYKYLGFIYVLEFRRGQNLGSFWLNSLKKLYPETRFWLTIEDLNLDHFYVKNGFQLKKSLFNNGVEERIYVSC